MSSLTSLQTNIYITYHDQTDIAKKFDHHFVSTKKKTSAQIKSY